MVGGEMELGLTKLGFFRYLNDDGGRRKDREKTTGRKVAKCRRCRSRDCRDRHNAMFHEKKQQRDFQPIGMQGICLFFSEAGA